MKTIRINTQKQARECFSRFGLKGVTKIKTEQDFLNALKKNDLKQWANLYTTILKQEDDLLVKYRQKCEALPAPETPLKGRGYQRYEVDILPKFITRAHFSVVTFRRKGGYFGETFVISPESNRLLGDYISELNLLHAPWHELTPHEVEEQVKMQKAKAEREAKEQQRIAEMRERVSKLGKDEVLKEFFANELHPAPEHIYDLKIASGMSWGSLREMYR